MQILVWLLLGLTTAFVVDLDPFDWLKPKVDSCAECARKVKNSYYTERTFGVGKNKKTLCMLKMKDERVKVVKTCKIREKKPEGNGSWIWNRPTATSCFNCMEKASLANAHRGVSAETKYTPFGETCIVRLNRRQHTVCWIKEKK